jgi:8-oxo-dGTP pyrophosphatase MutT (NUDIX family)
MTKPTFKNRQNELITTTDGRKLFHSRSVAVVAVLVCMNPDGECRIAIEKRGNHPGLDKKGLWCLPCGYLDWEESGKDAVRREVWEEIGLNLDEYKNVMVGGPSLDNPYSVKTEPDENRQNITLRYGMVFIQREWPVLNPNNDAEPDEVADAVWAKYSDILLDKYEFAFNHKAVIQLFWHNYIKE